MAGYRLDPGAVCAIIVTYRPAADFAGYLEAIRSQFRPVIVVDNGSTGAALDMLRGLAGTDVLLLEQGRNTGLGAALNTGVREARMRGFHWVVLFDQDTLPTGDMMACFSAILADHPAPDRIAVVGSRFRDRNRPAAAPERENPPVSDRPWVDKRRVITSGSLLSLAAFETLGPFREDLFIDSIDHEYCHRAQRGGWNVLQTTATLLSHSVGNYRRHRLLGMDIWRSHHSATRCYFMTRNRMLLARERGQYGKLLRGGFRALRDAGLILLFEADKAAKIRATLSGYAAGIRHETTLPGWIKKDLD